MNKWLVVALTCAGATLLGATVLREPIANAAQAVTATITGPLDEQGNVKVHEQGIATVRGTVGLSGTANTVKLDPSANGIRQVDNPVLQAFQITKSFHLPDGVSGIWEDAAQVPTGKRLVIEFAAVVAGSAEPGHNIVVILQDSPNSNAGLLRATIRPAAFLDAGGQRTDLVASQPMRTYIDAGRHLVVFVGRTGGIGYDGGIFGSVAISGHLVDVP